LIKNDDETKVIEIIRRHHKSGKSLQTIADYLNQMIFRLNKARNGIPQKSKTFLTASIASLHR
jgi:hypothetical protein